MSKDTAKYFEDLRINTNNKNMNRQLLVLSLISLFLFACSKPHEVDILIQNARIIDGNNTASYTGEIAISGDSIFAVGTKLNVKANQTIDANGMVVAPGFVNMLSWSTESLIEDGRGMSDILQGITLEVMGEGWSMGPLNDQMKAESLKSQADIKYDIGWTTLGEYLSFLESKGVSPNVASFAGATTLRIHELGYANRPPNAEELERMKALTRTAMQEGAMGIGSSLIYAPAFYAGTEELIELCKVASEYGGSYITHMRSEGNKFLEAVDEVIRISKEASIHSEIYHLKAGGKSNWPKMDLAIQKIDSARAAGLNITTDMYNYVAGATGLDASMPPWVQEGGYDEWVKRLKDPAIRKKVIAEMKTDAQDWENLYYGAGSPDKLILIGFKNDDLKKHTGKTLTQVAEEMKMSPEETAIELVIQDGSRVGTVYFLMSEENIKKQIKLPYMSFGSDAEALAPEGVFLESNPHPRAYGNFARLLGKYVREEKIISLEEAVYKLAKLPCENLKVKRRGELKAGNYADIVVFDPEKIKDNASFENPHQYSEGMIHVFVNGKQVLDHGNHTGATPGRFVRGPGYVEK